jgi:malate permease and related proteins
MFERILGVVIPVFGVAAVGYFYARRAKPDLTWLNKVNLDVLAPLLIFTAMADKGFDIVKAAPLVLGGIVVVLVSGLMAWPLAKWRGWDVRGFVPTMMFNNCGNMGLPLALLAFGQAGLSAAVALFVASSLLHFTVGVKFMSPQASIKELLTTPLSIAMIVGLICAFAKPPVPAPLFEGLKMLGNAAIPLMLFSLGARIASSDMAASAVGLAGAALRPVSGMIGAVLAIALIPLAPVEQAQLILFAALPPAVLNVLLAENYKAHPEQVAATVVWSHLASLLFVPLALALGSSLPWR